LLANGFADPDAYEALNVSGDGTRILVTGNFNESDKDTNSVIMKLMR